MATKKTETGKTGAKPAAAKSTSKKETGGTAGTPSTKKAGATAATPRKGSTGATRAAGGGTRKEAELRKQARDFAAGRPQGWSHDDWIGFLEDLKQRGHNVEDREAIGNLLERERLGLLLENVQGMGPQRVNSVLDRYGNLWRLKEASAEDVARETGLSRPLAEKVVEAVR